MIDPETAAAFALHENPKAFALLLGSGVSRAAMIPTGWEITLDLVRRIARLQGVEEQADWGAWHQQTTGRTPNYSELLDQLSGGRDERRAIVHRFIEPTTEDREAGRRTPTAAHRAIAELVAGGFIRVIITTNFDRLLEDALREKGVEPTILASDDAIEGAAPLIHCGCCIIKVHGDYLDTRIRNTEAELETYSESLNLLLDRVIDEHGLIVAGWSSDWDPALRAALQRSPNRRYPMFWVSRGEPSALAADLIAARSGRLIQAESADAFFTKLADRVQLQTTLSLPDPRSTTLVVAAAKKYVASSITRVQLHDLLASEMSRIETVAPPIEAPMSLAEPEIVQWARQIEVAYEPLARIFGVIGRWGGIDETRLALQQIKLRTQLSQQQGLVSRIALREYPAILLSYAFGLGAVAGSHFDRVQQLFALKVRSNLEDPTSFVLHHFLDGWRGSQASLWKTLAGLPDPPRASFSRRMHTLFSGWAADYVLDRAEYDLIFDTFELLGGLAALLLDPAVERVKLEGLRQDMSRWLWLPLGRAALDGTASSIVESWVSYDGQAKLIAAGFADADILDPALRHMLQQVQRRRFE